MICFLSSFLRFRSSKVLGVKGSSCIREKPDAQEEMLQINKKGNKQKKHKEREGVCRGDLLSLSRNGPFALRQLARVVANRIEPHPSHHFSR